MMYLDLSGSRLIQARLHLELHYYGLTKGNYMFSSAMLR